MSSNVNISYFCTWYSIIGFILIVVLDLESLWWSDAGYYDGKAGAISSAILDKCTVGIYKISGGCCQLLEGCGLSSLADVEIILIDEPTANTSYITSKVSII